MLCVWWSWGHGTSNPSYDLHFWILGRPLGSGQASETAESGPQQFRAQFDRSSVVQMRMLRVRGGSPGPHPGSQVPSASARPCGRSLHLRGLVTRC